MLGQRAYLRFPRTLSNVQAPEENQSLILN